MIVRNPIIAQLINQGIESGKLKFDLITADDVAQSQDAGLRHRREGLAYRLRLKDQAGLWRPQKRVKASAKHFNKRQKQIHQMRVTMANKSHIAFREAIQADNFAVFKNIMEPLVKAYNQLYQAPLWKRFLVKIKKLIIQ